MVFSLVKAALVAATAAVLLGAGVLATVDADETTFISNAEIR